MIIQTAIGLLAAGIFSRRPSSRSRAPCEASASSRLTILKEQQAQIEKQQTLIDVQQKQIETRTLALCSLNLTSKSAGQTNKQYAKSPRVSCRLTTARAKKGAKMEILVRRHYWRQYGSLAKPGLQICPPKKSHFGTKIPLFSPSCVLNGARSDIYASIDVIFGFALVFSHRSVLSLLTMSVYFSFASPDPYKICNYLVIFCVRGFGFSC